MACENPVYHRILLAVYNALEARPRWKTLDPNEAKPWFFNRQYGAVRLNVPTDTFQG